MRDAGPPSLFLRRAWLDTLPWLLALTLLVITGPAYAAIDVHLFWSADCPHCRAMAGMLGEIDAHDPDVAIHEHEVTGDPADRQLFERFIGGEDLPAVVPIVLVGDAVLVGHSVHSEAEVLRMIAACRTQPCPDLLAKYRTGSAGKMAKPPGPLQPSGVPEAEPPPATGAPATAPSAKLRLHEWIDLPFVGAIEPERLSLPLLTIAMAAIDGFNPCAMWVLVFLIGILLGIGHRRRMWLLAGTFLFATAVIYFLVLAAWLNTLLLLGTILWLRVAIGVVAIGAGGVYLRGALRREEVCRVTQPARRRRIFERLRRLVQEPSLAVAMAGIALLAVAVNAVELLCSAGVPAVYTGILAQSQLPALEYYAYLALYVAIFLADDAAIVLIAMTTLRLAGGGHGYARWARIAGGAVMVLLGVLLIFRPGWLSFTP